MKATITVSTQVKQEIDLDVKIPSFRRTHLMECYYAILAPDNIIKLYAANGHASITFLNKLQEDTFWIKDFQAADEITETEFTDALNRGKEMFKL